MLNNRWIWTSRSSADSRYFTAQVRIPSFFSALKFDRTFNHISDNKATEQRTPTEVIRSPGIIGAGSNTSAVFSFQGNDIH